MDCTSCGTANEVGRKFCHECGARLGVQCPACGTIDSGGSKFCGECGAALDVGPGRATTPALADRPTVAERRLVSVMFADLVGFTALAEQRDPEIVRELLTEYYDLAREVVARHKGTIDKFIGDAVMAVWGAPVAREDDAERAVRCALDLLESVRALAETRAMPELAIRAGVQTGEAAVSVGAPGQGLVAGDIVNTAARLQSAAMPGTAVVGEATRRAANRAIAFSRLPDQQLKGKAEAVTAWQATHLIATGGGEGRREGALEPPFVGRDAELWLVKDLYHATVREAKARLVSVMGQAGIGKTRLGWELEKYVSGLADHVRWLRGRSPAYEEGVSYWALGEVVRRAAGIAEDEEPASSRAKLEALLDAEVADQSERIWLGTRLGALLGAEPVPEDDRGELFAAWRRFFEHLASRRPLVLIFEDLHWADGGMLDFIETLLQWSRAHPILVITLARPELLERRPTWGAGLRSFSSLHLDPLPPAMMGELLAGLAPGLPAAIVEQVIERAEGVPLYAVETIRMLIDQGVLEQHGDGYRVAREPDRLALPETLQALVAARLDALPAAERRLLQDASVLGQTFQREALLVMTGETDEAALEQLVQSLVAKELLRVETDPSSPERGQIGFVQGATREVVYGGLGRADRRRRHLTAARYFGESGDEEVAGIVASHYLAAYQAAPDDPEAEQLRLQARSFLLAAADRARALHSYGQTLAHLEQAPAITDRPAERAAIEEQAGNVARAMNDPDAAQRYLTAAIAWYRSEGDAAAVARTATTLSTALIDEVRIEQAIELIRQTMEDLHIEGTPAAAPLMANLARAYMNADNWQQAVLWADHAIVAGEAVDDVASVIEALINRGSAVEGLGRPREAQALLRGALALAERHGATVSALRAAKNLAATESEDFPRAALAAYGDALELAHTAGELGWVSSFRAQLLEVRIALGEWQAVFEQVEALDEEALLPHEWQHLHDSLAVLAAFRGEEASAAELVGRWRSDPHKTVTKHEAAHHQALAMISFAQGRLAEAHAEGSTAAQSGTHHHDGHFIAGRAALWLGEPQRLAAALESFEKEAVHSQLRKAQRATLAAGLAALHGGSPEADYESAIGRWVALENRLEVGLAKLEHATFCAPSAATEQAAAEVRQLLSDLGAEGIIDRLRNPVATKP
jgi:class 3 adenylate cyclase/tetratricopeptide (TPR) repeat protein